MNPPGNSPDGFIRRKLESTLHAAGEAPAPAGPVPARTGPLDILIPIYNGSALLERCFAALLPTLSTGDAVILIDDASTDPGIPGVIAGFAAEWPETHVFTNAENRGFVGTSNRGLALSKRDIVLLNSDTEPCPDWLEHMQACLSRNPGGGIVCPLSDRATILSVLPPRESGSIVSEERAAGTTVGDVRLPTAVGFCMLLRRKFLDEVGDFSQAFAPGYGEENDLSMRAMRAGWDIIAADRACVYHHSGGSFTAEKSRVLQARHEKILGRIWPEYSTLVRAWWRENPLREKTEFVAANGDDRPSVLHVLHRKYRIGGTERVTRTLISELDENYRQTLVYPGMTRNAWCDLETRPSTGHRELMLNRRWIKPSIQIAGHGADLDCAQSERLLARLVTGSEARIVHFHHLLQWDSLLLPALARELGCRVVISAHDFWFNCPVYNQLEYSTGQPCGRSHAQPDDRCATCLSAYSDHQLPSGQEAAGGRQYAVMRHALIADALQKADAVVVPSKFLAERLLQAYPAIKPECLVLEPHGIQAPESPARPGPDGRTVVAFFGGDQRMKGAGIVLALAELMKERPVEFRIFGRIKGFDPATLPSNVQLAGFYQPDDVNACMQGVDLALLPSFYEESFSMVASECWANRVPVLASSRGALSYRVLPGVNGWLVPDMRPESWAAALEKVLEAGVLDRCRERLSGEKVRSSRQASRAVDRLYRKLLDKARVRERPASPAIQAGRFERGLDSLRRGALNISQETSAQRVLGVVRDNWGTAAYRVRFPLTDLQRSSLKQVAFHEVKSAGFGLEPVMGDHRAGRVLIQPFLSDDGLRAMEFLHRESGFETILVVDDLWTGLHRDNPVRKKIPANVEERLAYAASLSQGLVLTTPELKNRLGIQHDNVHVVNNALPEWIWSPLGRPPARREGRLRIGWSGAPQHASDLEFLEPVIRATRDLADWVFMGMCLPHLEGLATEVHPMVPFDQYPSKLASLGFDLAIAPLADTAFNRCKSHLKVLEYGVLGVPVVAAELEPYRHCPVTRVAPNDVQAWTDAIRGLLTNERQRLKQGADLRDWVTGGHMCEHRRQDWLNVLGGDDD